MRKDVSIEAKRGVYNGLVLATLLFGAEHWCLTAKMVQMLRAPVPKWEVLAGNRAVWVQLCQQLRPGQGSLG
jgi:hypothetical protein